MGTKFSAVYNRFLNMITDDLYIELTPEDTMKDLRNLLIQAIPGFEFPRKDLYNYSSNLLSVSNDSIEQDDFVLGMDESKDDSSWVDNSAFAEELTPEEQHILALLMLEGWIQRQVTSIENTRMKYSGTDFKMTSQANHLAKLKELRKETF